MGRVLIATDAAGWHGRRLEAALAAAGHEAMFASLPSCRIDTGDGRFGLVLPGFEDALPAAVIVREIAAGTFEQVTLRLGVLHALAEWGVPVVNSARAVERTVDKSATSLRLHRAGIASPATWVTEDEAAARAVAAAETAKGHRLVSKPLFGSQGKGLALLHSERDLPAPEAVGGVYYLQRFVVAPEAADYRVVVVGNDPVAAMRRRGPTWIHNVAQGAACERVPAEGALAEIAVRATHAVGASYAGVDLIRDAEGTWQVIEVNGIPAWRGLQAVSPCDIAASLVAHVVACMRSAIAG